MEFEFNFLAVLVAAVSTLVVGFVWYHPKVFGTAWMKEADMTEDKMKGANMGLIFGLAVFLLCDCIVLQLKKNDAININRMCFFIFRSVYLLK